MTQLKASPATMRLVKEIDKHYSFIRENGFNMNHPEWGRWSHDFNKALRAKILEGGKQTVPLNFVYVYWWNRCKLLALFESGPEHTTLQQSHLLEEGRQIRRLLSGKRMKTIKLTKDAKQIVREFLQSAVPKKEGDQNDPEASG